MTTYRCQARNVNGTRCHMTNAMTTIQYVTRDGKEYLCCDRHRWNFTPHRSAEGRPIEEARA